MTPPSVWVTGETGKTSYGRISVGIDSPPNIQFIADNNCVYDVVGNVQDV